MIDKITHLIQQALPDAVVHVTDPASDGRHFEAIVISQAFEGMPLVKQHHVVMDAPSETARADFRIRARFPKIGERVFRLDGRRLGRETGLPGMILPATEDVTRRREGCRVPTR